MPIPMEYQHASQDFEAFLADCQDSSGLTTRNQAYTMVQGVLYAFRRRLTVADALVFANVLPPIVRAIFVADWTPAEGRLPPFETTEAMTREVQGWRREHNFAPSTAIRDVAHALRRHVGRHLDSAAFDQALATLPSAAAAFWQDA